MGATQVLLLGACCLLAREALCMPASSTAQRDKQRDTSDAGQRRSQEDIMFGNQQNKPAGMVDDLIVFPERKSGASSQAAKDAKSDQNSTQKEEKSGGTVAPVDDAASSAAEVMPSMMDQELEGGDADEKMATTNSHKFDYYDYLDDGAPADSRETAPQQDNAVPSGIPGELDYSLYDYSDSVFRRKRTLRNSLEELLRNRRIPRRALRYKRDANMDDLLYFLTQMSKSEPYSYYGDEEIPAVSRIPLSPQVQQSPLEQYLSELGAMSNEDRTRALLALAALADQDPLDQSERAQEQEQSDVAPGWFQVARRSRGSFYPQDYRYLVLPSAGQKRAGADRWGRVLRQHQLQRADDEANVNRLYALAGLMAEPDQEETWREA
ncbi:unnamed protein product [Ixodes hexagonus]